MKCIVCIRKAKIGEILVASALDGRPGVVHLGCHGMERKSLLEMAREIRAYALGKKRGKGAK